MKARQWFERGMASKDSFEAFSNFWRGFNNLFGAFAGDERQKISKFLREHVDAEFSDDLLRANASQLDYLLSMPVADMRGNGRDTSKYIQEFQETKDSVGKLIAVFMIIYQVRCNLEHGQKSPSRDRDRKLCEMSAPFVAAVIEKAA